MGEGDQTALDLIKAYDRESPQCGPDKVRELEAGRAILDADPALRHSVLVSILLDMCWVERGNRFWKREKLAKTLFRKNVDLDDEALLGVWTELKKLRDPLHSIPLSALVKQLEARFDSLPLSDDFRKPIQAFRDRLLKRPHSTKPEKDLIKRLGVLLGEEEKHAFPIRKASDAWTSELLAIRSDLAEPERAALDALVLHAASARGSKPTKTYLKKATALLDVFPPFGTTMRRLVDKIGERAPISVKNATTLLDGDYTDLLRGLVWLCADHPELALPLGGAAERCYKKVPGVGPRCAKTGTACVNALSRMGTVDAMGQLSRLQSVVKHASTRKQLAKALDASAEAAGVTRAQLEEMAVPDGGLTHIGRLEQSFPPYTAVLQIESATSHALSWRNEKTGKVQKSVPAAVKEGHADELKALRKTAKALKGLLMGQRHRIERLFVEDRVITLADWRKYYVDHPLVGFFARRLIWRFGQTLAAFPDPGQDRLTDVGGTVFEPPANAGVRLWHPADSPAEDVGAWRTWLFAREITQPIKQAFREVYLLTPAERETERYSNRFAAHILRQHQFQALCATRGWRFTLMGNWDSANTPTIHLPELGWRVEYWVDGVEGDEGISGVYRYISTDQVRFYEGDAERPARLEEVPPRVFTELMRDVDLFAGVCSVGNDPNWFDTGIRGYRAYWERASFGELGASASSRKAVLERLLPRLKIAGQSELRDRFLVVRGERRTYKIHLGSGNILMEPNDQYLCIVTDRKAEKKGLFLPFEGDGILSIILSKAFLLADDMKIKDKTILRQIGAE